jgi:hypothetical protein
MTRDDMDFAGCRLKRVGEAVDKSDYGGYLNSAALWCTANAPVLSLLKICRLAKEVLLPHIGSCSTTGLHFRKEKAKTLPIVPPLPWTQCERKLFRMNGIFSSDFSVYFFK